MRKLIKILCWTTLLIITACGISFLTDKTSYSNWEIKNNEQNSKGISWAKFEWTNDTLRKRYFERTSMNIPCRVEGLRNVFTFQFDLGADITGVYENTLISLATPSKEKIKRLKSEIQFWNNKKYYKNLSLNFGAYTATNEVAYIFRDFGEKKEEDINHTDTIHLGTIGADLFKNKILIIDYPKMQFAICDDFPKEYTIKLIDIELDKQGRIILPMKIHNKTYRIMFDNGSSIFPLITDVKNISNFSSSPDIDTIKISSWGKMHNVTGKLIKDTFELAGQKFSNIKVYANHSGYGIDDKTDGITGNALFWEKTVIIDFKNKKFGVQ